MTIGRALSCLLALTALASPGLAQNTTGDYEARYGKPVDVALSDIAQGGTEYENRAVRTSGRLDFPADLRSHSWVLRDTFGAAVVIAPLNETAGPFEDQARQWVGERLQITGVVVSLAATSAGLSGG